jgi:carbon monoxide dehydrogenase subunit G
LIGENQYEGELNIKVGPVQGRFNGRIEVKNVDEPNSYDLKLDGQGAQGFVQATAHVAISPLDGETRLRYEGDAQIGGRMASVGQRLLDSSAKAIIKQSLGGLNAALASPDQAEAGDDSVSPATTAKAPSQTEFAANVAKEVAKDLIPKPVWILLAALLAALVVYLILR